jgi:DNA polymerase-3 subunit epsilon
MQLKLKRPIAFFDLETTGTNVTADRIVEISIVKVHPNGDKEERTRRINPLIPIPEQASKVHGIYLKDVINEPPFSKIAKNLHEFIGDSDLAGFNSNKFDVPFLIEEFNRAGINFSISERNLVDVQNIFHKMEKRTLAAGYKFYCGKDLTDAHSASADTFATLDIMEAMLDKYSDTEVEDDNGQVVKPIINDIEALAEFSKRGNHVDLIGRFKLNENQEIVFNFGKHKEKKVEDVLTEEPSYYAWMMKGDFPANTKQVLEDVKMGLLKKKFN